MGLLDGIRVLDLTRMLAGPYGAMMLADQGAEVVKVETPGVGDLTRAVSPQMLDGANPYFLSINRNKHSVVLDLKSDAGRAVFLRLAEHADVVYDNFRPGVMAKLGLDADALHARNPRLVCCSLSGFGATGPAADQPAYDLIIQARAGTMSLTGPLGGEPVAAGVSLGDIAGGMYAAFAIAAALVRREQTGRGDVLDLGLLDCQIALQSYIYQGFIASGEVPGRRGTRHHLLSPFQVFPTSDGYVAVVAFQDKHWAALCRVLDAPELETDDRFDSLLARAVNKDDVGDVLAPYFTRRTTAEWLAVLEAADIPCGPLQDLQEATDDAQLRARGMVRDIPHPSGGTYTGLGNPVRSAAEGETEFHAAPDLGADTDDVLGTWLAMTPDEIAEVRAAGACG